MKIVFYNIFVLHLKIAQVDKAMGPEGKNKKFMENAQTYPEFSKVRNIQVYVGFKNAVKIFTYILVHIFCL